MAVAEVDLDMDDLFGDGRDVEELLDMDVEQDGPDEAVEVPSQGTVIYIYHFLILPNLVFYLREF